MSAMESRSEILFDGICKVQQSSPSGQPKKLFSRNREILPWKHRYCLISRNNGDDLDSVHNDTLTVYKSKKILRTNTTHATKICCRIQLDSQLTLLAEDRLADFVFHLEKDKTTVSFSCETKFIRDSWVSTITQSQAGSGQPNSSPSVTNEPQITTTLLPNERKDKKNDDVISLSEASSEASHPSVSVYDRHGSVGGGAETTRFQLRREQSLPICSEGLELEFHDDKPPSKSSGRLSKSNSGNVSANQFGIYQFRETKGLVVEKSTETGDDKKPEIIFGHPSATLPPKPPLLIPIAHQQSLSQHASNVVLDNDNGGSVSDGEVGMNGLSTGNDSGAPLPERVDPSGPMWMTFNKDENPKNSFEENNSVGVPVDRENEDFKELSTRLTKTKSDKKHASELFFDLETSREKHLSIPYSVFDFDSLNISQDFDELCPQLGEGKRMTSSSALQEGMVPLTNGTTRNAPVSVSVSKPVLRSGFVGDSEMSEVDQDMDMDQLLLLGPEEDSMAAMSQLQLQREVKTLVELNNELHVQMEQSAAEARRRREQDHQLALTMQSEIKELSTSCHSLTEQNNHLIEKMKAMSVDMKDLDLQCQEKERMCLKNESDLNTLDNYKKLTESLAQDNTSLLCELDKIQVFVQKGMSNEQTSSNEKKILLDQLQNSETTQKKSMDKLREAEAANTTLNCLNEKYRQDLAEMTSTFRVSELELKTLRSRFDSEVLDEVSQETIKIHTLETENTEYRRKELEYEKYKCDNIRLNQELSELSALVQRLSADVNVDTVQKLTKAVLDVTIERDECKTRLSDKHDSLLLVESKLVDEQKKVFELTMCVEELENDQKRSAVSLEATKNDFNRKMDILSANSSKVTSDYNELMERCTTYKAQLRDVEEELQNEYEFRLKERKEFNVTRLDLEDSISREMMLSKKNQCRVEELEQEQDSLKNKVHEHCGVSVAFNVKIKEMEKSLDDSNSLLVVEQRNNRTLVAENEALKQDTVKLKASSATSLQESQIKIEELQNTFVTTKTKLKEALQHIKEQKKDFKTNTFDLTESLRDANARCKTISDEVSKMQHTRQLEKDEGVRELSEANEKVKRLSSQLDTVNCELNLKSLEIDSHLEKNTMLQLVADNKLFLDKKLVEVQLKFNQSEIDVVTLKDKLTFLEKTVKHHRDQEEELKSQFEVENKEVCHTLNEVQNNLKIKISECDQATVQLSDTRTELEMKNNENVNLRATVTSLRDSLTACETSLHQKTQENDALQGEVLTLSGRTELIKSLEDKIEFDHKKQLTLQSECDLLCVKVDHLDTMKIETDERIALLESEVAVIPDLESQLAVLSGVDVEKRAVEKKLEEVEQHNHDHMKVIFESTAKERSYQEQLAELRNQVNSTRKLCDKKIRATETALDTQTSDRNLAFQVIQTTVQCLLGKTSPAVVTSEDNVEDFDQWYDQLCVATDGKDIPISDSATLLSYGCLLKAIVGQLRSSCTHFLRKYIGIQPFLKKINSEGCEKAIEEMKACIGKKGEQTSLLSFENVISNNTEPNTNVNDVNDDTESVLCSDFCAGLHHSVDKMTECFEDFVVSLNMRNTLIEVLVRDNVRLCEERDAMGIEVQRVKTSAYKGELDASRCKREKLGLESILRSKMSTQDFFDVVLRHASNNTDLNQYSSSSNFEEKSSEMMMKYPCPHSLSPPQEFDFLSTSGLSEDDDRYSNPQLQDHDDCASSVSWCSNHENYQCTEEHNNSSRLLKTGRAARVSLRKRGHLPDESKIADMFSADTEFEF